MSMYTEVKTGPNETESRSTYRHRQILSIAVSCLVPVFTGVSNGLTAVMLPKLREDKYINYEPSHESWIASVSTISLICSSICCGKLIDSFGRKKAHIFVTIPFLIGWIIIACANSTSTIIIGRFITGFSAGANKVVTMVYIAEISEPNLRSIALLMPGLTVLGAVFLSHLIGYYVHWRIGSILCLAPALICTVAAIFLKESPLWLISKGRIDEGIEKFRWFRGTSDAAKEEMNTILKRQSKKPKTSVKEDLKAVFTKAFMKPILIVLVIVFNIHLTGLNVIIFYCLDIFKATFKGDIDPFMMMMVTDSIRIIVAIIICVFEKMVPKKNVFMSSNFGNSISVFGLAICLLTGYNILWVSVLCLVLYVSFSSAIVTIAWTFVPELLPSNARGFGSGFVSGISYILLFAMVKTTPDILTMYGAAALFLLYGISTLVCGFILCFVLPDTTGKTLQSIEDKYKDTNNGNSIHSINTIH